MASLHNQQPTFAHVTVGTSYAYGSEIDRQRAYASIMVNGQTYRRSDQKRIFRHGEIIMVPMEWFWKLFAEAEPELVGISWTGKSGRYCEGSDSPVITYSEELSPLALVVIDAVFDAAFANSPEHAVRVKAQAAIRSLKVFGLYQCVEEWDVAILDEVLPKISVPAGYRLLEQQPEQAAVDGYMQPGGQWLQLERGYAYVLPITEKNRSQQWERIIIFGDQVRNSNPVRYSRSNVGPWSYSEFDAIDAFMAQIAADDGGPQLTNDLVGGEIVS